METLLTEIMISQGNCGKFAQKGGDAATVIRISRGPVRFVDHVTRTAIEGHGLASFRLNAYRIYFQLVYICLARTSLKFSLFSVRVRPSASKAHRRLSELCPFQRAHVRGGDRRLRLRDPRAGHASLAAPARPRRRAVRWLHIRGLPDRTAFSWPRRAQPQSFRDEVGCRSTEETSRAAFAVPARTPIGSSPQNFRRCQARRDQARWLKRGRA